MKKMKIIVLGICLSISNLAPAQMNTSDAISSAAKQSENNDFEESNIWNVFQNRRSVRKFKPDAIPEEDILKIVDAARMAPTSGNQQPWKFLIIRDKNKINEMINACISRSIDNYNKRESNQEKRLQFEQNTKIRIGDYFSAPVYIVVLTDNNSKYPSYNHYDGPLAAGYLMLAARALGYGTVFITDVVPDDVTKNVLQIPDTYTRVCITPLGIPYEWPNSPLKKKLEEFIIREKF